VAIPDAINGTSKTFVHLNACKGGAQGIHPIKCPVAVNGTMTDWPITKSAGNTIDPVKFSPPSKYRLGNVTPLTKAVPADNPIAKFEAMKDPPTSRTDPGPHGDGVQVANVKFSGSPDAAPCHGRFGRKALT